MKKLFTYVFSIGLMLYAHNGFSQINVSVTRSVTTGTDDAEQRVSSGAMDLTSSDLEIMNDGANTQYIGIRFTNIIVPQGITIDSAFIQFANKGDKTPVSGAATIRGELNSNAGTYTATANNISSRTSTTANVTWPGSTDSTWSNTASVLAYMGPAQRTPDIKTVIQEIVNQGAWVSGNALAVILNGSGVRNAYSYNGSSTFAPQLTIYYTQSTYTPLAFPIALGSVWKYNDSGVWPNSTWKDSTYDDSSWGFKRAKFGYGDAATTPISFGGDASDKHTTTYFRSNVLVSNTAGYDSLVFRIIKDDGAVVYINGVEAFRTNMPLGTIYDSTLALTQMNGSDETDYIEIRVPNTLIDGSNTIAVEVHQYDTTNADDDMAFDMQVFGKRVAMPTTNFPIAKNSEWYYLDNGTDQGTAWRDSSFYENLWNYGPGKLGYSDAPATTLGFGPNASNKYITYYFRKKINVLSVASLADTLVLGILRDDAAVVYVNGIEIIRSNIQDTGVINYLTKSLTIIDGAGESTYNEYRLSKNIFVDGMNTIAVEIHQRDSVSSDLGFDLELKEDPRVLYISSPTPSSYVSAGSSYAINWVNYPSITTLNIDLSIDNGATWNPIASNIPAAPKSFMWSVPNINASSSLIRIIDSANVTIGDTIDATFWIYPTPAPFNPCAIPNHIGCFTSVQPMAQTSTLRYPDTSHVFQRIAKTGDALTFGGTVGANNDFTGFVPKNGSSKNGTLGVNHETDPGGVSMFHMHFNDSSALWEIDSSGAVNFAATGLVKTIRNCSGGITPWETFITSEESYNTGDANSDGYTDVGWHIEIDPNTRQVMDYNNDGIKDKLWQMGRMSHENIVVAQDSLTAYFAEDGGSNGLYKFVANHKMKMDSGTLYVLQRTGSTGTWIVVPNSTQAQCNTVSSVISGLGGTGFNGAEDVEINPINGMIYFTSKGNSLIYRFTDNGSSVSNFENYVGNNTISYTINYGSGSASESWASGIDNLVFDDLGNLWAQQDGSRNHLWVIRPDHTPFNPKVELFATTPSGSEPTGLTFTPDYKFGFISFQHPGGNTTKIVDAAGDSIVFNTHTTIAFANKNNLGPLAALPVEFAEFTLRKTSASSVGVQWSTASENNNNYFTIEQSIDGKSFKNIADVKGAGNSNVLRNYQYTDVNVPQQIVYYRIKQTDFDGKKSYSTIRSINMGINKTLSIGKVYPNPINNEVKLDITLVNNEEITTTITDINGKELMRKSQYTTAGTHTVQMDVSSLNRGIYFLTTTTATEKQVVKIIK